MVWLVSATAFFRDYFFVLQVCVIDIVIFDVISRKVGYSAQFILLQFLILLKQLKGIIEKISHFIWHPKLPVSPFHSINKLFKKVTKLSYTPPHIVAPSLTKKTLNK